ncbi:MAG TPA: aminopeptidase [Solirubrobacteraceae bacterium]|nr:aminopeptidase [Solirubrobacteraceae bacterium]
MPDAVAALAHLAVNVGARVTPGQTVIVNAKLGQEPLARAIAAAAYDAGAHLVDVGYSDPHVFLARMEHAPEEALGQVLPWVRRRPLDLAEVQGALISLSGPASPGLLDAVDPGRIGRDSPAVPEHMQVIAERAISWTIVPGPTEGWARLVYPDLAGPAALERLWSQIAHVCRLGEDDVLAAWTARSDHLHEVAARLTAAELDTLRFTGPGTDLTVGLLRGVRWTGGAFQTRWGQPHLPNIPTEEVFTSPDPARTHGTVASTKPLLVAGRAVTGLRMRFQDGRAVAVDADDGAELMRELVARDENANRLGEVALVDASGRIGPTHTVFHDTLLDENAASHIAVGAGFPLLADDERAAEPINHSGVHTDFMIGGPEIDVVGVTRDGREIPVLMAEQWAL